MKIICSKAELLQGVNTVLKAVPAKTTMPILECILIDTTDGQIKLTANDMELEAKANKNNANLRIIEIEFLEAIK